MNSLRHFVLLVHGKCWSHNKVARSWQVVLWTLKEKFEAIDAKIGSLACVYSKLHKAHCRGTGRDNWVRLLCVCLLDTVKNEPTSPPCVCSIMRTVIASDSQKTIQLAPLPSPPSVSTHTHSASANSVYNSLKCTLSWSTVYTSGTLFGSVTQLKLRVACEQATPKPVERSYATSLLPPPGQTEIKWLVLAFVIINPSQFILSLSLSLSLFLSLYMCVYISCVEPRRHRAQN